MPMPPVAVLSDIHGNRWALEAVWTTSAAAASATMVNLGDCLYGPLDPAGTAQMLMELDHADRARQRGPHPPGRIRANIPMRPACRSCRPNLKPEHRRLAEDAAFHDQRLRGFFPLPRHAGKGQRLSPAGGHWPTGCAGVPAARRRRECWKSVAQPVAAVRP